MILNYIDIKDLKETDIKLNSKIVHLVDKNTIQVEKCLRDKYEDNKLIIMYRKSPEFVSTDKTIQDQYVDIPISLLECLIQGMAYYAHSVGLITQDSMKYGTAVDYYAKRYEESIQKAIGYGTIYPQNTRDTLVDDGNFF